VIKVEDYYVRLFAVDTRMNSQVVKDASLVLLATRKPANTTPVDVLLPVLPVVVTADIGDAGTAPGLAPACGLVLPGELTQELRDLAAGADLHSKMLEPRSDSGPRR
jgi:hypothetical protein